MSQPCLFCAIAAGDLPAHILHQDDHTIAFLDLFPIHAGHALVIPRAHHIWFEDMPAPLAGRVIEVAQRIARAMKSEYGVERVGMAFTGIHVPHAHAHVVPMYHPHDVTSSAYLGTDRDAFLQPPMLDATVLADHAARLKAHLGRCC